MAQVTLRINGHVHTMGCKDGEEGHLAAMAEEVEKRVERAKALGVPSGETKLLLMAALIMADELHDRGAELEAARKAKPAAAERAPAERAGGERAGGERTAGERAKAERIGRLAARAEDIAASLKQH